MKAAMRTGLVIMGGLLAAGAAPGAGGGVTTVDRRELCVTSGEIEQLGGHRLGIEVPEVRAVVLADTPQAAEIQFTYRGPSAGSRPLASGAMRRQVGLKLRAQDGCNLLYVMWRIEPRDEIVVSIKHNPGQRTSAECHTHGYETMKARRRAAPPPVTAGSAHTLRAELVGRELRVWSDGSPAWQGTLPAMLDDFDGPVGLRTDNVRLEFAYRVGGGAATVSKLPPWLRQRCAEQGREANPD
jgi:hypothetical protein